MNKLIIGILALSAALTAPVAHAEVKREHRSVWDAPGLGEWPSGVMTTQYTADRQTKLLQQQLDKYKAHNINVVYFHARSYCDAMYESAYEPWSAHVAGSRGTTGPIVDPMKVIIEECHKRGIELYAWINPYRYSGKSLYGGGDYNYEVSHPEWLLTKDNTETILNPGLPEVQQRIVDVCKDILTKYDVDGIIFDDYFYTGGTPEAKDKDLYDAYKAAGGTAKTQMDWRRENVNTMISKVMNMIAETKPYVNFAISPAGRCNPPNHDEYGLPDSNMGDWQYAGIASDPTYWLANHLIDMVSPQLYWSMDGTFPADSRWWALACNKFNRNLAVSTSMSIYTDNPNRYDSEQFIQQQLHLRSIQMPDRSGMGMFSWKPFNTYREVDPATGASEPMSYFFHQAIYQNPALQPLRPWRNVIKPEMVKNIKLNDGTLTWDATSAGRYTVYAVPNTLTDAEFSSQPQYLVGITYNNSYELPEDRLDGYRYAVAVYDRYGNEYAPLMMGGTPTTAKAPKLISPAANGRVTPLGDFTWEATAQRYVFEVAECNDALQWSEPVLSIETTETSISSSVLKVLDPNKDYLWRVTASGPNALEATSNVQRFSPAKMEITSPANGATEMSVTPTFTFTKAVDGAEYFLEISGTDKFTSLAYSTTVDKPEVTLSNKCISTGEIYYARVTARKGELSSQSDVIKIQTANAEYTAVPKFVNPSVDGQTIYSNSRIEVEPWEGMNGVTIELASDPSFPSRTRLTTTLTNFATQTDEASTLKISSKSLEDGQTYYLRARGRYKLDGKSTVYTDYCETISFVYSSSVGVEGIGSDVNNAPIEYFDMRGMRIANPEPGQVVIRRQGENTTKIVVK